MSKSSGRDPKSHCSLSVAPEPEAGGLLSTDPLAARLRGMVRDFIERIVQEELDEALQAGRYQRQHGSEAARRGYRHGSRDRELTTSIGTDTIDVPRGRMHEVQDDGTHEWSSELLPKYSRRAKSVDDAILMSYLSGSNTRRIKGVLRPLLFKDAPLSKSAVSRVVRELKKAFDRWRTAPLDDKSIVYLYLDGISVRVRVGARVESMVVLAALGIHETGERELLGLDMMAKESTTAWEQLVTDLDARGLSAPLLCIIDGNPGLHKAIRRIWKTANIQRCTVHKIRNLEAKCPKRMLDDLRRDFHAITEAATEKGARRAYKAFIRKWKMRSDGVVRSFEEAGEELLTYLKYPKLQWRSLRTTNVIERLHGEFRRRVKTQSSLPNEASVLYLFFGLWASGQIRTRRIDGYKEIPKVVKTARMSDDSKAA